MRPGYRPPEDVEVYKNRTAEAFKSRGSGGVPGAEAVDADDKKTAASSKNAKKRDAKKRAAATAAESQKAEAEKSSGKDAVKSTAKAENGAMDEVIWDEEKQAVNQDAEKEKEARKLSKKLRQARELKDKKDKGDALLPEQFEKVIRISELIRQLEALGFDVNGEKKAGNDTG